MTPQEPRDTTDYGHRTLVNLLGAIAVLIYGLALGWTVLAISDYLKLERCLNSGRAECRTFAAPPRETVRLSH